MDDTNEETQDSSCTDPQFRLQSPVANMNTAESSLPSLTEMLAVISESAELYTSDLQALMATSSCTSENSQSSTVTSINSTASKAKHEVAESVDSTTLPEVSLPSESQKASTETTNLTCYDENLQPLLNISLQHKRDSPKFNVKVEKCENVIVGDYAKVNICCGQKGPLNENGSHGFNRSRSTVNNSLVQADGDANQVEFSRRRRKQYVSPKSSVKKSPPKKNSEEKIKTKWRFPLFLSDFTDPESIHNEIDQWLTKMLSSLLSEAQDLDDFGPVINLLEEAMRLRGISIPDCILKLAEAIQKMGSLVCNEGSKKYDVLLTETQFVLAEFYTKEENYLSALHCLKSLEGNLSEDTEKSRLYAKIAKVMELCLEYSVDFTGCENELLGASNTAVSDARNPDEIVLCYYEKALNYSHKELLLERREIFQRCCYLGKANVLMKCWKGQTHTKRNLPEVRENLLSTEGLFNRISPAMKCQYYLTEAFLLYHEGGYKMAADKTQTAYKIADEENFLERKCLGSKRLHFLLAELDTCTGVSKPGEEFLDLNSVEDNLY
ncbi:hypothetical protein ACROYT_G031296 [Oculina patagonica]